MLDSKDSKEPVTGVPGRVCDGGWFSAVLTVFSVNRNTADISLLGPIRTSLTAQAHRG